MKLKDLGTPGERRAARALIETPGIWLLNRTVYRAVELLYAEIGRDVPSNVKLQEKLPWPPKNI